MKNASVVALLLAIIGCAGQPEEKKDARGVADVKTCGCPFDANCGDCCGPDCRPT